MSARDIADLEAWKLKKSLQRQPSESNSKYLVGALICIGTALVLAGWATGELIAILK